MVARWVALAMVLLIAGCAAPRRVGPTAVDTQVDPNAAFARYRSFQVELPEGIGLGQPIAELDRHLQNAIAQELTNKGLIRTDSRRVDLVVNYRVSAADGSIVIDLIDVQQQRRVWRGVGLGWQAPSEPGYDQVSQRVRDILASYPRRS